MKANLIVNGQWLFAGYMIRRVPRMTIDNDFVATLLKNRVIGIFLYLQTKNVDTYEYLTNTPAQR